MRQRTINITLATTNNDSGHILPVNVLKSANLPQNFLYSAGRDGVIIQYENNQEETHIQNRVELHSDWVNDILLFNNRLVSASSDLSVQWWDPALGAHGLIGHHHDYVKVLSNYNNQYVVSGGLDRFINFWDINKSSAVLNYENVKNGDKGSIYSLSSNQKLVAFGDNDYNIVLFDPKSKKVTQQFNDHKDIVKSIILNDSNYLLSGSSDNTVKVFDLRANRVLKNYEFDHSIWSLHSNPSLTSFETILAGDSYGSIYKIENDLTTLIGKESKGILSITEKNDEIWTSSMGNSNITNWSNPSKTIHNKSKGIIRTRMLNNRRNVVTLNESNEIIIWDILKCCQQENFKQDQSKTFDEIASDFQTTEILPSWCNISIKAGKLVLTVKESNFTTTEIYGDELMKCYDGIKGIDEDIRYNLGKIFFMSIFQNYLKYLYGKDLDYRTEKIKYLEDFKQRTTAKSESNDKSKQNDDSKDGSKKFKLFSRRSSTSKGSTPVLNEASTPNESPISVPKIIESTSSDELVTSLESVLKDIQKVYDTTYSITSLRTSLISPPSTSEVPRLSISNNVILNIKQKLTDQSANDEIDIFNDHLTEDNYEKLKVLLPKWVGSFILKNELRPPSSFSKIGFTILRNKSEFEIPDINAHPQPAPRNDPSDSTTPENNTTPEPTVSTSMSVTASTGTTTSTSAPDQNSAESPTAELSHLNLNPPQIPKPSSRSSSTSSTAATTATNPSIPTPPTTSGTAATSAETALRLNAYNMLRIKKIKSYIYEKFSEDYKNSQPKDFENWIELVCNDEVVPNSLTLATLRTFVWKNSGDVVLTYRRKKELE